MKEPEEDVFQDIQIVADAVGSDKHCAGIGCPMIEHRGPDGWYCHAFKVSLESPAKWIIKRCRKCIKAEENFYELYNHH